MLFILAVCIAVGTILYVYSETAPSSQTNIPVDIPVLTEPEYEDAETPEAVTSVENYEFSVSSDGDSESYVRSYSWTFAERNQTITVSIPVEYYDYYRNKSHSGKDFDHYALSEDDRTFLGKMIDSFKEQGEKYNFTDDQNVLNIISFVQAMPYTSDDVTTGYDEYPRYPIETLVDGGGDCEDSAILAAALLLEMGYGVVLLELPGHMALGVAGSENISGTYYEYEGSRYYYVETTASGYKFGEIPAEYQNAAVKICTMNPMPSMSIQLRADLVGTDLDYAYYKIQCDITNRGPTTAHNVYAVILAESEPFDMTRVWAQSDAIYVGTMADEATGWAEYTVQVPRRNQTRFSCVVYGDNFNADYSYTRVIFIS
ncbi:hypothetical protein [Methanimicrococcus hacksteinii]|uniref:hypothetical protein n=1 Tax=Methanimicrococcus hacksteinii TaxID=3028293 RepID=UPI00298EF3A4|nr:hypothetical protein [Methanimicrococcus sp. At1]